MEERQGGWHVRGDWKKGYGRRKTGKVGDMWCVTMAVMAWKTRRAAGTAPRSGSLPGCCAVLFAAAALLFRSPRAGGPWPLGSMVRRWRFWHFSFFRLPLNPAPLNFWSLPKWITSACSFCNWAVLYVSLFHLTDPKSCEVIKYGVEGFWFSFGKQRHHLNHFRKFRCLFPKGSCQVVGLVEAGEANPALLYVAEMRPGT